MATLSRRNASRTCDFCRGGCITSIATDADRERDICRSCVEKAAGLFGLYVHQTKKLTANSMLSALMKRLLDGKTKTLIKAGLLDTGLNLTTEGAAEVNALILQENIDKLVEVAEAKIKEGKKKSDE